MRSLIAPLAALSLLSSACVIHGDSDESSHNPQPVAGDVTFFWTFAGKTCAQAPEVNWVHVVMESSRGEVEAIENDGYFRCTLDNWDGIKLRQFEPGSYNYTVDAIDGSDRTLYTASGSVYVNGHVDVRVDLTGLSSRGSVEVSWAFGPAQKACEQSAIVDGQAVNKVRIQLNAEEPIDLPCNYVGGQSAIYDLEPRTHQFRIEGIYEGPDSTGAQVERRWYLGSGSVAVAAGGSYLLPIKLDPVASGVTFAPVMADRVTPFDCTSTGVTQLQIQLFDKNDNCYPPDPLSGGCGAIGSCAAFASGGFYFDFMPAGDTFDGEAGLWKADWTAVIRGWPVSANNVTHEGWTIDATGAAGPVEVFAGHPNRRFVVPMYRK